MREFALDNTSPDVDPYEYENDPLCNLLSCVGLKCLINEFHNHGVFTLEDFLDRTREEFLSYGFINNYDYDNLVEIFNNAVSFLNDNEDVTIDKYRQSIMENESTQRLRLSISRHSKPDVAELDDNHRDSLLDELGGYRYNDYQEASFDDAMKWKTKQPKGYRHTVNVGFNHPREHEPFRPIGPPLRPRQTENITKSTSRTLINTLPSINETSFCDGMKEISGGVYTDNDLTDGSVEVYLASNGLPPELDRTATSISIPVTSRLDSRHAIPTAFPVDCVFDDSRTSNLVNMLAHQLKPKVERLLDGQSFTCCFYGSLLSPAAALFYDNKSNQEDFYESSFNLEDPVDIASNSSLVQQLGEMALNAAADKNWHMGMSAFLIQDNAVFDLLKNKARLSVSDSGTIIFMKNITCYEVQNRIDIHAIISTIKYTESIQPLTGHLVVVFQLINPQGEYVSRMAVILLAPCDKIIPVEEKQLRGSTIHYKTNGDVTSALMTLSRVLTPRIRQPFRDNKLTLYLRPFIFRTSFVLIGCLPPYQDTIASIPTVYLKKTPTSKIPLTNPHKLPRGNRPINNTENFVSIIRYCNAVYKNNRTTCTTTNPVPRRTMAKTPASGFGCTVGDHVAFHKKTTSLDNDITNLRKAVNDYLRLYSRDLSVSREEQPVSTLLRKASDLSCLLNRLARI